MLNSLKMKLYKLFVSKSTYVLCIICFVFAGLIGLLNGYMIKNAEGNANKTFKYYLSDNLFVQNVNVLLYLFIGFIMVIAAFSLKGYIKSISAYVQNTFLDISTDVIVGIIFWIILVVLSNIGMLLGYLIIFGSDFSFAGIGNTKIVLSKIGVFILSVVAYILMLNIIQRLTKKVAATMAIAILLIELIPGFTALFNFFLAEKLDVSMETLERYELITAQNQLVNSETSLNSIGIIACTYIGYSIVFGIILFLIRKRDRI